MADPTMADELAADVIGGFESAQFVPVDLPFTAEVPATVTGPGVPVAAATPTPAPTALATGDAQEAAIFRAMALHPKFREETLVKMGWVKPAQVAPEADQPPFTADEIAQHVPLGTQPIVMYLAKLAAAELVRPIVEKFEEVNGRFQVVESNLRDKELVDQWDGLGKKYGSEFVETQKGPVAQMLQQHPTLSVEQAFYAVSADKLAAAARQRAPEPRAPVFGTATAPAQVSQPMPTVRAPNEPAKTIGQRFNESIMNRPPRR